MRLISLNMEGERHFARILSFLATETPDAICLLEAPHSFTEQLQALGFQTTFAPMIERRSTNTSYTEGVIFASRHTCDTHTVYYVGSATEIPVENGRGTLKAHPVILAEFTANKRRYNVAATHLMVTKRGQSDAHQQRGVTALLDVVGAEPAHILCGDCNMPRGYNDQYERFIERYKDAVPAHYTSSLDRALHRYGSTLLDDPIFDSYMVDYVFTQPPYHARDVRLQFGVSDHAAVVATIEHNIDTV